MKQWWLKILPIMIFGLLLLPSLATAQYETLDTPTATSKADQLLTQALAAAKRGEMAAYNNLMSGYACYRTGVCRDTNDPNSGWINPSDLNLDDPRTQEALSARYRDIIRHWNDYRLGRTAVPGSSSEEVLRVLNQEHNALRSRMSPGSQDRADGIAAEHARQDIADGKAAAQECHTGMFSFNFGACAVEAIGYLNENLIVPGGRLIIGWSNDIFNLSFQYSVREFGTHANSAAVKAGWTLVRDFTNIALIFALLYAAAAIILQLKGVNGKQLVGYVILAALLVNFSAFFASIVINSSNVLANQIYCTAADCKENSNETPDLSHQIFNRILRPDYKLPAGESSWSVIVQVIARGLGQFALSLITATVLLAGAVAMIVRFIQLLLVIIFSPIFFLGKTFPLFKKGADKWQDTLISQAIFAPAFLLMILIVIQFLKTAQIQPGTAGIAGEIIYMGLINGLMIGALLIGRQFGAAGSSFAQKKLRGLAGSLAIGAPARLARTTLGRAGKSLTENESIQKQAVQRGVGGWMARQVLRGSDKLSKASFDVRNIGDLEKKLDLGKVSKTQKDKKTRGFAGDISDKAARTTEMVKLFKNEPSKENQSRAAEAKRVESQLQKDLTRIDQGVAREEANLLKLVQSKEQKMAEAAAAGLDIPQVQIKQMEDEIAQTQANIAAKKAQADKERALLKELITKQQELQKEALATNQERFAQSLENTKDAPWYHFNKIPFTNKPTRTRKAQAKKIREEFGKTKGQKDLERISKILEEAEKEKPAEPAAPTTA